MSPILKGIVASGISGHLYTPVGAYDSLATIVVPSGGLSEITFSGIPSEYRHLQIRYISLTGTATNDTRIRFNSDTGSNYVWHQLQGNGASAAAAANTSQTVIGAGMVGGSTYPSNGIIDILDYSNTNKYKTTKTLWGLDQNGTGWTGIWSGLWMNTNSITSINITTASGNFNQYSSFALYGVK